MVFPLTSLGDILVVTPVLTNPGMSGNGTVIRFSLLGIIIEIVKGRSIGKPEALNSTEATLSGTWL
ncbi:hypothetical protein GCM10028809_25780 [Spirosoma gilvum]